MSGVGLLDYDKDFYNSLYLAANPKHYCAQALPKSMKETAAAKLMGMYQGERAIDGLIKSGVGFAAQNDTWTVTNASVIAVCIAIDDSAGTLDANTISTNVVTLTNASTGATTGLIIYKPA